uniref:Uncharacterized protein n=1 Tax=Periophthalmus magnuspinnatus TaxID=409849 RepID=A0A3B3ZVR8_9GOBI
MDLNPSSFLYGKVDWPSLSVRRKQHSMKCIYKTTSKTARIPHLSTALKECSTALEYFLNNHFADALALLKPWKDQSMYHAMGYCSILVMQAGMTFDPKDMDAAMTSLRDALQTCQRFRKKTGLVETLTSFLYRQTSENLTEGNL